MKPQEQPQMNQKQQLPLATGTGDNDEIKMMEVGKGVSNPDVLLKIAKSFK